MNFRIITRRYIEACREVQGVVGKLDLEAQTTSMVLNDNDLKVGVSEANVLYAMCGGSVVRLSTGVASVSTAGYVPNVYGLFGTPEAIIVEPIRSLGSGCSDSSWFVRGERELVNHLGNVVSVVSDRKEAVGSGDVVSYWKAKVLSATDCFRMLLNI